MNRQDYVILNPLDSVGVMLKQGNGIPSGHKFAITDIKKGDYVIKYGEIIGKATKDIYKGEWVHSHNLASYLDEEAIYKYSPNLTTSHSQDVGKTFMGYRRKGGRAGIRNDIFIIPTVGCVNPVCKQLETQAQSLIKGSIDGVYALTHQFGCSQLGDDHQNIRSLLSSIAKNPNASFVLFVGLGCENNRLCDIMKEIGETDNIAFFNCQDVEDEISYGMEILKDFAERASILKRESVDISELCIGLKCGGSDGFSGITANPLVGSVTERIIKEGGSAILTEVPEMFGAEQILMNRCETDAIFGKYKKMILDFKSFYIEQGFPVYENPSPGNREGGITTLEEKSLGCIKKAGNCTVVDVLNYGEPVKLKGLSVLNAPGNDLIAATALAASGCQIVLFTTGRGTPFSTFVPTMKISSNNALATKKANWIDFDASSMDSHGLYQKIIDILEGKCNCRGENQREIAFFKTGVTL